MISDTRQPTFSVIVREPSCPASITILRTPNLHEAVALTESLVGSVITDIAVTDTEVKNHIILEYAYGKLYKTHARTIAYPS